MVDEINKSENNLDIVNKNPEDTENSVCKIQKINLNLIIKLICGCALP